MSQKKEQKTENAISVQNVSKQFIIPHDRTNTLKGTFVNFFHRKSFESFYALQDISFEVKKGKFVGNEIQQSGQWRSDKYRWRTSIFDQSYC